MKIPQWMEKAIASLGIIKDFKHKKSNMEVIMTINKIENGSELHISLEGRLDTITAPQLEAELKESINGVTELDFDLAGLEYISSAGLRVLLSSQKTMNKQGNMTIRNVVPEIMEIFEVTGFIDIFNIEK